MSTVVVGPGDTLLVSFGQADPEEGQFLLRRLQKLLPKVRIVAVCAEDIQVSVVPQYDQFMHEFHKIHHQLSKMEKNMTTQADIDQITSAITTLGNTLDQDAESIAAHVDRLEEQLKTQGVDIDLTGLRSAVDKATANLADLNAIVPVVADGTIPADTSGTVTPTEPDADVPADQEQADGSFGTPLPDQGEVTVPVNTDGTIDTTNLDTSDENDTNGDDADTVPETPETEDIEGEFATGGVPENAPEVSGDGSHVDVEDDVVNEIHTADVDNSDTKDETPSA